MFTSVIKDTKRYILINNIISMILIILGTRADIIKFSSLFDALKNVNAEFKVIHTGQHDPYELMKKLSLPDPDYFLGKSLRCRWSKSKFPWFFASLWSIATIFKIRSIIKKENPEFILYHGNTLAVPITCFAARSLLLRKYKLVHVESGVRGNTKESKYADLLYWVGEIFGDILLAPSTDSYNFLMKKYGKKWKDVILIGDIQKEVINRTLNLYKNKDKPKNKYVLINTVRSLNTKERLLEFLSAIKEIKYNIVYTINPRIKNFWKTNGLYDDLVSIKKLRILDPLDYPEFLILLKNAQIVLSDSGGVQAESAVLNVPCIVLNNFSSYKDLESKCFHIVTGINKKKILSAIRFYETNELRNKETDEPNALNVTDRIIQVLDKNSKSDINSKKSL